MTHSKFTLALFASTAAFFAGLVGCSVVDKGSLKFDDSAFNGDGGSNLGGDGSGGNASGGGSSTGGGSATGGAKASCDNGDLSCNGKQVQVCAGDTLVNAGEPCQFVCADGSCTGMCVPNTKECLTTKTFQKCQADGTWDDPAGCIDQACVNGACAGVCEPGDFGCNGTTPQACGDDGQWVDGAPCPGGCTNGACTGSCSNGAKQCHTNTSYKTCDGTTWEASPVTACVNSVCQGGNCVGDCQPGQTRCTSKTTLQGCNSGGEWAPELESTCPFACIGDINSRDAACGGECIPGSRRCGSTTDGGVTQICSDAGKWTNDDLCYKSGQSCFEVGEKAICATCFPGSTRCSPQANAVDLCSDDGQEWKSQATDCAASGYYCYEGSCQKGVVVCLKDARATGCASVSSSWECVDGKPQTTSCGIKFQECNNGSCGGAVSL